jgi:hypothetical protein
MLCGANDQTMREKMHYEGYPVTRVKLSQFLVFDQFHFQSLNSSVPRYAFAKTLKVTCITGTLSKSISRWSPNNIHNKETGALTWKLNLKYIYKQNSSIKNEFPITINSQKVIVKDIQWDPHFKFPWGTLDLNTELMESLKMEVIW